MFDLEDRQGWRKREQKTFHSRKTNMRKTHSAEVRGKVTGDEAVDLAGVRPGEAL